MDDVITLLAGLFAWFFAQPIPLQVIVAVGLVAVLYSLLVIARLLLAALYGAFRGLG